MQFGRASQAAKTSRKDAKLTQQRMAMEDDLFYVKGVYIPSRKRTAPGSTRGDRVF
ncbi:hypothetical protein [Bacillus haynesii]|uniref:hypothetical protein n=1 Tax=Bacillus haynesii TaxID=1925021 RepID=UPI00227F4CC9|nr:hypothetical protein [Bacillus haynesii]MCY8010345.1 hypothetical protein [Bacillus haynesii]MCY9217339.1 hypothetical protein [Bacillus haynesii]